MLPALKALAEWKAGHDGVKQVVGRRFAMFPQPARSDAEWDAWWADYFDVLSDVPLASLEAGMRAYVALPDSEFLPKPGRLRELAFLAPSRTLTRYHRATLAHHEATKAPPLQLPEPTPEERAKAEMLAQANREAVLEMLADFKARAIPATPKRSTLPYIGGILDEGGITPQMREFMERQRGQA